MELRLPQDKIQRLKTSIAEWFKRKSMQKERTVVPYSFVESYMHSYHPRSYFYATANHHIMYSQESLPLDLIGCRAPLI